MVKRMLRATVLLAFPLLLSAHRPAAVPPAQETASCLQTAQMLAEATGSSLCELACMRIWDNQWVGYYRCVADADQACPALADVLGCPPCGGPE